MQKELSAIISALVKNAPAEAREVNIRLDAPEIGGFSGEVIVHLARTTQLDQALNTIAEASAEDLKKAAVKTETKKTTKKDEGVHFKDQPLEVVAGLVALYGPKSNYAQEEIASAVDLLGSDAHGKVEELAGEILAVFQDCNQPVMLNTALASIGGYVIEWWDDLADHAARVGFFETLKNAKPAERDGIEPVIYAKDGTGGVAKFEGKGQLEAFNVANSDAEMATGDGLEIIDAKEFAKLNKPAKEKKVDFGKLRDEGLALVRANAAANRDAITDILTKFGAINDAGKPSWSAIKDEQLVDAVEALKALKAL